ncbi:MAG TPA: DUF2069 domain-containing protein [Steroidobacteraceae bacterium]
MNDRARAAQSLAVCTWLLLAASVACWPFIGESGIGLATASIAFLPLLLPLAGIARGSRRAFRFAAMTLAPALALAVTEFLVNVESRPWTGTTLALILLAFASLVAALRTARQD